MNISIFLTNQFVKERCERNIKFIERIREKNYEITKQKYDTFNKWQRFWYGIDSDKVANDAKLGSYWENLYRKLITTASMAHHEGGFYVDIETLEYLLEVPAFGGRMEVVREVESQFL